MSRVSDFRLGFWTWVRLDMRLLHVYSQFYILNLDFSIQTLFTAQWGLIHKDYSHFNRVIASRSWEFFTRPEKGFKAVSPIIPFSLVHSNSKQGLHHFYFYSFLSGGHWHLKKSAMLLKKGIEGIIDLLNEDFSHIIRFQNVRTKCYLFE